MGSAYMLARALDDCAAVVAEADRALAVAQPVDAAAEKLLLVLPPHPAPVAGVAPFHLPGQWEFACDNKLPADMAAADWVRDTRAALLQLHCKASPGRFLLHA